MYFKHKSIIAAKTTWGSWTQRGMGITQISHHEAVLNLQLCSPRFSQFSSVAQSCPSLCDPMPGSPCPSPTPQVYSNSCPLNRRCHPTISSEETSIKAQNRCSVNVTFSFLDTWTNYYICPSRSFPLPNLPGDSGESLSHLHIFICMFPRVRMVTWVF